jgi:hypothetical protein
MNSTMNCRNNKSCTFLDLFLFILNGIDTGLFNDNAQYNGVFYDGHYITPNVILKMRQQTRNIFQQDTDNIFQLNFTQVHVDPMGDPEKRETLVSCKLSFSLIIVMILKKILPK